MQELRPMPVTISMVLLLVLLSWLLCSLAGTSFCKVACEPPKSATHIVLWLSSGPTLHLSGIAGPPFVLHVSRVAVLDPKKFVVCYPFLAVTKKLTDLEHNNSRRPWPIYGRLPACLRTGVSCPREDNPEHINFAGHSDQSLASAPPRWH